MQIPDKNIVSVQWLQQHLEHEKLCLLYTQMANPVASANEKSAKSFIPGSVLFDFENVFCDHSSALPHTMPSAKTFTKQAQKLGVNSDSVIVVYDAIGIYTAPRVWWMFKSMGHQNVFVLNGGLPEWLKCDLPSVEALCAAKVVGDFKANYNHKCFVDADDIMQKPRCLLDARSAGRFCGTAPEPRKGLRAGHIPGAINLPFDLCLEQGHLKPQSDLMDIFAALSVPRQKELVFSCGSGVTACVLALAASEAGYDKLAVYDGSWSEWGSRADLPVTKDC